MHPQFEENGQLYHLDVDVNPPTLPVGKIQIFTIEDFRRRNVRVRADQISESNAKAFVDYKALADDEISFEKGDIIDLIFEGKKYL